MKSRLVHVVAVSLVMLSLTACTSRAADAPAPEPIPFTMQPDVPRSGLSGGFGVDHIALDSDGIYLCVLRRGDDLASLRARFNPSD